MTIGTSSLRLDGSAKVSGRARYTGDLTMPGMVHAVFVRSTIAHGRVLNIDASAALDMPNVMAVFTANDVPAQCYATAGHPFSLDPAHQDVADRRIVTDTVRIHGDEVAIVVARDVLTARKAAQAVHVTYAEQPVLLTPEAALAPDAPALHPALRPTNLLANHAFTVGGDAETAMAAADVRVNGRFNTPTVQHCHLETQIAWAYMDDMQRIVVVSSTQIPHICRRVVGQALGIPWGDVRVIKPYIGGGFGNKQDVCLEPVVAFLTKALGGVAVSMELTREECLFATRVRHAFDVQTQIGVQQDGTITAISLDVTSNTGAYASHGHSIAAAGGSKLCTMYPRASYSYAARTVYTNIPTGGAFRGYGSPQTAYALECAVEDAARALGMDAVDFRLHNCGQPGDRSPMNGQPVYSMGLGACLEEGHKAFDWQQRKTACELFNATAQSQNSPLRRGVGVAGFSYGTGTYPVNVEVGGARLIFNQDGTVTLTVGATEIGQGADTAFAQMAAEVLGIDFSRVRVVSTQDTDVTPFDPGAFASRQTFTAAPAIHKAASMLRQRMLEHAAAMTKHDVSALELAAHSVVFARMPHIAVLSLEELGLDSFYNKERACQLTGEASVPVRQNPPAFGCTYTEIEVDIELCRINIRKILNVHDAGRIINPQLATGQVQGGMCMAVGWALYEELLLDPITGRVLNPNLLDYKVPTACDMPELGCAFIDLTEPAGPFGTKALGEPPIISPAPALRNALLHATGIAINRIPMTPKVLFAAFSEAGLL